MPYFDATYALHHERARQAKSGMRGYTIQEISALDCLAKTGCSSSPKLFAWKNEAQEGGISWVPGGFMDYVLMEKVSGIRPPAHWERRENDEERAQLLASFKEAYL